MHSGLLLLVFGGLRTQVLKFVGESAPAVITLVRREGGERSDVQHPSLADDPDRGGYRPDLAARPPNW